MLACALPVGAEEPSPPEALSLTLYVDGVVDVDYSVAVDPSLWSTSASSGAPTEASS